MPANGEHANDALTMQEHAARNAFDKVSAREQMDTKADSHVPGTSM